jgi:hypothetical protein
MISCVRAVLGVDAAWTEGEPSGVAVDWRARPSAGPGKPLAGGIDAYGDATAVIWVPRRPSAHSSRCTGSVKVKVEPGPT